MQGELGGGRDGGGGSVHGRREGFQGNVDQLLQAESHVLLGVAVAAQAHLAPQVGGPVGALGRGAVLAGAHAEQALAPAHEVADVAVEAQYGAVAGGPGQQAASVDVLQIAGLVGIDGYPAGGPGHEGLGSGAGGGV